jgi:hypothetical protein
MTDIEIVNLALSWCGEAAISSFNDATPEARWAKANYAATRDQQLESREWSFATRRELLAQDAAAPTFGPAHQYILPSDVLTVWRCYDSADGCAELADWTVEGRRVLTSAAVCYAVTTYRANENTFSPGFSRALSALLTAQMAIPLTENRQLASDYHGIHQSYLATAAWADGRQGRSRVTTAQRWPGRRPTRLR